MTGFLRSFLGDRGRRRDEPAFVLRDVSHRVFVERPPEEVWQALVAPAAGAELGVDCVRVLALPRSDPSGLPEFAAVWRRPNGRAWTGLATVVGLEHGSRVVTRAADGSRPLTVTTTIEPLDHGAVVAQVLDGVAPGEPVAEFARSWLARALLGLKADVEGRERDTRGPDADATPSGPALPPPGEALPISESASVEVALPPGELWAFLMAPEAETVTRPSVERVVRVVLADEPDREHVLAVHRHHDGRRAVGLSAVVEASEPGRIVERDLTSTHESDVVTTIEPTGDGSRLTETLTAWLPSGPGHVVDPGPLGAHLRSRLATVKTLAEAGVRAPRDPRTGFLPPGEPAPTPPGVPGGEPPPPGRPSVPSSVLLPPPHVVAPARPYAPEHDWWDWNDLGFYTAGDLTWW